jgi:hypothetical protein
MKDFIVTKDSWVRAFVIVALCTVLLALASLVVESVPHIG